MPRYLDAAERDRTVIAAAWRVIARDGVTAMTVRKVAAEAGLPPSSLRYTFPTQAAMRERALVSASERIVERVHALPADISGAERAEAALLELLPLDEERRLEMEVFLALGIAASTDQDLEPYRIAAMDTLREVCATAVELLTTRQDRLLVDHLHAVVDGLSLHLLISKAPDTNWARQVIATHLAQLAAS
ncbi:putative TetR-family transcriptional regulator [Microbacterium sp. C448]|uniref:TetR/AcrR family transcriptional regulator n=1 Tax=Microbacterium sp. C448 TaxID=1177594 RepID=UPI0003DE0A93|nr:TetR family transcriptional regulator C-terminal domain-containing protein [Microbacterium sp. C448]CDK01610.1 putative TetR-family transcriptional regulator [Microbacterium sp. C448]